MYRDVENAFDNGMRYAWRMVGDLFNMLPCDRVDALGYSEVNEIVWTLDPLAVKKAMVGWKELWKEGIDLDDGEDEEDWKDMSVRDFVKHVVGEILDDM